MKITTEMRIQFDPHKKFKKVAVHWVHPDKQDYYHREGGPAHTMFHDDGSKHKEEFCLYNQIHREDGPAIRIWRRDGSLLVEHFLQHGLEHNLTSAASVWYNEDGSIEKEEYAIGGIIMSVEEWLSHKDELFRELV